MQPKGEGTRYRRESKEQGSGGHEALKGKEGTIEQTHFKHLGLMVKGVGGEGRSQEAWTDRGNKGFWEDRLTQGRDMRVQAKKLKQVAPQCMARGLSS